MNKIVIKATELNKVYKLYDKPIDRMKEALSIKKKIYANDYYALENISFEATKGETIGIIGENGSGKSTLLKIITGVLSPTHGTVSVNGKISALLELGAGFNPEYTGLENVYLNGTMMGYTHEEMEGRIPAIEAFADIGEFIHHPVKTYSSGMFARLAFAVAINVEPDILIVDEALSVGDVFFQKKCYMKFTELKNNGVTIIFVSHDLGAIRQYCTKVMWLENGKLVRIGDTDTVCEKYLNNKIEKENKLFYDEGIDNSSKIVAKKSNNDKIVLPKMKYNRNIGGTNDAEIISFSIRNSNGEEVNSLIVQESYQFTIAARFFKQYNDVLFGFVIENLRGIPVYATNNYVNQKVLTFVEKEKVYVVTFELIMPKLHRGKYIISPAIAKGTQDNNLVMSWYQNLFEIDIINNGFNLALIELDCEVNILEMDEIDIEIV